MDYLTPWRNRQLVATNRKLLGNFLSVCMRTVFNYQRARARKMGIRLSKCGSVTFVHRFELPPPTDAQIEQVLLRMAVRIERLAQLHTDDPIPIDKILAHLELPTRPPLVAPARPPPQIEFDLFA